MIERIPSARVLLLFFGYLTRAVEDRYGSLHHEIRGARLPTTYHDYLARTMLYSLVAFLAVLGVLAVLVAVSVRPVTLSPFGRLLLFVGFVVPAAVSGYAVYRLRLYYPRYVAEERARAIESSMPTAVNFMFALSRAGVPTARALELLSDNVDVLGEAADEFRYAWRDMEYFGADVVSALDYLSGTTRFEELSEFVDGYLRTLTGRGDLDEYLEERMADLFEEAELKQEGFLSTLGVLAEVYVAVFVAFPIFTLIILIVMGFVGATGILTGVRIVVYAIVPLAAIGFLVLLDTVTGSPLGAVGSHRAFDPAEFADPSGRDIPTAERDDPADEANARALDRYRTKRTFVRVLATPLSALRRRPRYALYLGIAIAVAYLGLKATIAVLLPENLTLPPIGLPDATPGLPGVEVVTPDAGTLRAVDESLVEALMIVFVVYGAFYELRARYLSAIERELPAFLGELAQRHRMGMSLSGSIVALEDQDMGRIDEEIERMARDFRLQSTADDVLKRFANRVRSPVVTRVVVLLAAASDAAERLEPVIEALARRAELARRLKRKRRVEMSLYVIVIYLSYLVFVVILAILNEVFLPAVPSGSLEVGGVGGGSEFDPVAYRTVFFHASVIQGTFSGLVGGKMSEGRISAGVKHALVMVALAYLVFSIVLPAVTIGV